MTKKLFCGYCRLHTLHEAVPYNPDKPEEGEVWQCKNCNEHNGFVDTAGNLERRYFDEERTMLIARGTDRQLEAELNAPSPYDEEPIDP